MGKICKVTLNKETFYANCGDLLLDSAITNGVELPHDCRSGICGSCKVRVVDGKLQELADAPQTTDATVRTDAATYLLLTTLRKTFADSAHRLTIDGSRESAEQMLAASSIRI